MKRYWVWRAVRMALFGLLAVAVASFVVMSLWNWLMPGIAGWHAIGYWQAAGLLILSRILFGGFRGRHGYAMHRHWRRRMAERWERMSPEERERFREGMRGGCGHFGRAQTEPKGSP